MRLASRRSCRGTLLWIPSTPCRCRTRAPGQPRRLVRNQSDTRDLPCTDALCVVEAVQPTVSATTASEGDNGWGDDALFDGLAAICADDYNVNFFNDANNNQNNNDSNNHDEGQNRVYTPRSRSIVSNGVDDSDEDDVDDVEFDVNGANDRGLDDSSYASAEPKSKRRARSKSRSKTSTKKKNNSSTELPDDCDADQVDERPADALPEDGTFAVYCRVCVALLLRVCCA